MAEPQRSPACVGAAPAPGFPAPCGISCARVSRTIDRDRLGELLRSEEERFVAEHSRSKELFERGERSLLAGVPMPWMTEWAGAFPVFVAEAVGRPLHGR